MATLAVELDEESLVLDKISDVPLPEGVRFKRLERSAMWFGEPAWRLYYNVSRKIPLTKKRGKHLVDLHFEVQKRILDLGGDRFPLVEFIETR